MIFGIVVVIGLIFLVNLPGSLEILLTKRLAVKSCEARDNFTLPQWQPLSRIEWLRLYPLKKLLIGGLWLFCLFYSVRGIFLTWKEQRTDFLWITLALWFITILTACKAWRYVTRPYHCIPTLNCSQAKNQLKEALRGECFELIPFQDKLLRRYAPVLLSRNWAIIDGTLISRKLIQKIYFLHDIPGTRNAQIKIKYLSGEEFCLRRTSLYSREERAAEMLAALHQITSQEIEGKEEISPGKDKSFNYWKMNYRGKFKRTLWFIPVVAVLCFLTPYFMGKFWLLYDIVLVAVLIAQLIYTYRKMKDETEKK